MQRCSYALNIIPEAMDMEQDKRMCCGAMECFGCIYTMDICCTIPTLQCIEQGEERYSFLHLPFYEASWPCMCTAHLCGYPGDEQLRRISKYMKFNTKIFECCPFYNYFYPTKPADHENEEDYRPSAPLMHGVQG